MSAVNLIQKLSSSFLSKQEQIISLITILAVFGTAVMISAGMITFYLKVIKLLTFHNKC